MKKKATKLLAVIAMATSPGIALVDPPRDPWNATSSINVDRVRVSLAGLERANALVTARPRQMPSGAPACGNVASRAPRLAECAEPPAPSSGPILANTPSGTNAPSRAHAPASTSHTNAASDASAASSSTRQASQSNTLRIATSTPSRVTGDHR